MNNKTDGVIDPKINKTKRTVRGKIITAVLCLLAAFALWLYVMQTESPTYTDVVEGIEVRLENEDALRSAGLSVYSGKGQTVKVEISGKKSLIDKMKSSDVVAAVDLSKITSAGRHPLPVSVDLPAGLTLVGTTPDEVTVFADETVSKTVDVKVPNPSWSLPVDYTVGTPELEFNSVIVSGPAGKVNSISYAQVVIDMSGKTTSFNAVCPILLFDESDNEVTMDNLTCTPKDMKMNVTVPIVLSAKLEIPFEFKYGLLNSSNAKVTISPSVVSVTGDEKTVGSSGAISPIEIDEKKITENPYTFKATPSFADGLTVDPAFTDVTVTVRLDPSLGVRQFAVSEIELTGTSESAKYEIVEESVTVTVRGTWEQLEKLGDDDVCLSVDMTGYDSGNSGTVTRPAAVVIKGGSDGGVFEAGSYFVTVKIS